MKTLMPNAIILKGISNRFFVCSGGQCCMDENLEIHKITETKAKELGWVFTDHIKFCAPEEPISIICPECKDHVLKQIGGNE